MNQIENFFTRKIRISNLEIGLIKIAAGCLAIAIGAWFADFFRPYLVLLVVIAFVAGIWATAIWLKAMKETS
jgi:hypothetical protein